MTALNTYEGLFVFEGSRTDAEVAESVQRTCGEITRLKGEIIKQKVLGKRTFARPIRKRDSGHYVRILFKFDPSAIDALLARYKLAGDVFRHQITRVPDGADWSDEKEAAAADARAKAEAEE